MKHILKKGQITALLSDKGNAGWSGEVHLINYNGEKYVLRKSQTLQRARFYEEASKRLGEYRFLPTFLGRLGKNVLFEYIEGRDLTKKESPKVIKQLGQISAHINKIKENGSVSARFNRQIRECLSGKFKDMNKKTESIISKEQFQLIMLIYNFLKKEARPILAWDVNDMNHENFRLRNGKVYLVDIESIGTRVMGFGIGKAFTKWFKTPEERKSFIEGYKSVSSTKFLTEKYLDFILLNFLIQELNYTLKFGERFKPRAKIRKQELSDLLAKYDYLIHKK